MPRPQTRSRLFIALLALLAILTAAAGTAAFSWVLWQDGIGLLDVPLGVLFAILMVWIAIGFWTATFGFVRELARGRTTLPAAEADAAAEPADTPLPRTAILMPVYNEDPAPVFARIKAMHQALRETGQGAAFDFYILSDSTEPDVWLEEESAWAALRMEVDGVSGIYYRHRSPNTGRKAGNLHDFCERWGSRYRYMIVLDADSLVAGPTLVEMVRRMEQDPTLGLLQTPPMAVNRESFFARLQQFSAHFYGRIFTSGYALWSAVDGNYWGHNAIIRVEAFMTCCGLPTLPGKPPLGGEILSHDFAEAALLRKAGWKVVVDHDLEGSYEECPTNLIDYAKRDQRWCQGNLQHIRLTLAHGMRPVSRLHLAMGAMSYLSSPLWALFIVLVVLQGSSLLAAVRSADASARFSPAQVTVGLFVGTIALLLLPKLWSLLLALARPGEMARFGGAGRAALSVLIETFISMLVAPVLMLFHTTFVVAALLGRSVQWDTQRREEASVSFRDALHAHATHTIAGLAGILVVQWLAPWLLLWMSPLLAGLVFSVPMSMFLSSARAGRRLREKGLLLIPEEMDPPAILREQRRFLAQRSAATEEALHPFLRVVLDPAFNTLHVRLLEQRPPAAPLPADALLDRLKRVALSGGPTQLSKQQRMAVLSDPQSMRWLHAEAWKDWPTEVLERVAAGTVMR